jgi:hypothetical protein
MGFEWSALHGPPEFRRGVMSGAEALVKLVAAAFEVADSMDVIVGQPLPENEALQLTDQCP